MPTKEFEKFLENFFSCIYDYSVDGASGYIFYKERGNGVFINTLRDSDFNFVQMCVWLKNHFVLGGSKYQNDFEPFLFFSKNKLKTWNGQRNNKAVINDLELLSKEEIIKKIKRHEIEHNNLNDNGVLYAQKNNKNIHHSTEKPVLLLEKLILNSTNENDIVLDPFAGSCSVLIACENTNRQCLAIELDKDYIDVSIKRFEKHTKIKAVQF